MDGRARDRRLEGLRVLIVEDEMLLAMDYEEMLQREGCTIVGPAPRSSVALALLDSDPPDVALLDLNLGGELSTPLAEAMTARGVPFVIVSGYTERAQEAPVFRAAPRLGKPLQAQELVRTLAAMLRPG